LRRLDEFAGSAPVRRRDIVQHDVDVLLLDATNAL
jgi:hypothetical protein